MRFRVWAPRARERVDIVIGGETLRLEPASGGWWEADLPAAVGTRYTYRIDGEGPFPDPRSPSQPDGVHGPSEVVDLAAFPWTDRGWCAPPLSSAVVYELHVGTFSPEGTFEGAIPHLEHLVELGVTHVELMPVASFPGRHGWGYDGAAPFAPHAPYGGPVGLARLVDACHARGLAVLLDVVYNHLGPSGNYLGRFGPYFTDRYRTPWGEAVNLDGPESDEVRRFLLDNARHWLETYHLDGLRLDAVHALFDSSATPFLEELAVEVGRLEAALGRKLVLIAESDLNDPRLVRSREAGGPGLDAAWSDDLHHALHAALTGETDGYYEDFGGLGPVAKALRDVFVHDGGWSPHRRRRHGRPIGDLPGWRFLGYLQNHDQIGNRAQGKRIGHLVPPGRAKAGAAVVLTSPCVPLLFQGEEWAASTPFPYFTDHDDPDLAAAVRDGRRREFAAFGWDPADVPDPQSETTVAAARLDWTERDRGEHAAMLAWYRDLIALRRRRPELTDGRLDAVEILYDEEEGWLAMRRGRIATAVNLGTDRRPVPLGGQGTLVLLASELDPPLEGSTVTLSSDAVAIVELAADR